MSMSTRLLAVVVGLGLLLGAVTTGVAKTFRYAATGDILGLDPHGNNEALTNAMKGNIYEGLVVRGWDLSLRPGLATTWTAVDPTTWRFELRQGVTFHDGSPFTADDVVFSFARAADERSTMRPYLPELSAVRKIDEHTVELVTAAPDPVLLQRLPLIFIMSEAWAEANGATVPAADDDQGSYANLHANGTGPFQVVERDIDTLTVLTPHAGWWGEARHNLTRVEFRPIASDATRVAALLSGDVDLIFPVPPQDVEHIEGTAGFRVLQGPSLMTVHFGMDQGRDELLDMPGSGQNPFKDRRVREAFHRAIDIEAIRAVTMRGAATPAGLLIAPGIEGFDAELNQRVPYDPELAKALLAEAGYAEGFPLTIDCPNDRYVNDEEICVAVAGMLSRIGIAAEVNAQTKSRHFAKAGSAEGYNTSMYMLGWIPGTYDAHHVLHNLMTVAAAPEGSGIWNAGKWTNPRVEELTKAIASEMDPDQRLTMIHEALRIHKEDFGHLPLHQQALAWGVADSVAAIEQAPNDFLILEEVRMR